MRNTRLEPITEIANHNILDLLQDGYQLNFADTNKVRQSLTTDEYCIYYDGLNEATKLAQYLFYSADKEGNNVGSVYANCISGTPVTEELRYFFQYLKASFENTIITEQKAEQFRQYYLIADKLASDAWSKKNNLDYHKCHAQATVAHQYWLYAVINIQKVNLVYFPLQTGIK